MKVGAIDAKVKINGAYYREVLLTQKLLSVMHKICREFFIFQQGNDPAH